MVLLLTYSELMRIKARRERLLQAKLNLKAAYNTYHSPDLQQATQRNKRPTGDPTAKALGVIETAQEALQEAQQATDGDLDKLKIVINAEADPDLRKVLSGVFVNLMSFEKIDKKYFADKDAGYSLALYDRYIYNLRKKERMFSVWMG